MDTKIYKILFVRGIWDSENEKDESPTDIEVSVDDAYEYTICLSRYKEKGQLLFTLAEWEEIVEFVGKEIKEKEREGGIENANTDS